MGGVAEGVEQVVPFEAFKTTSVGQSRPLVALTHGGSGVMRIPRRSVEERGKALSKVALHTPHVDDGHRAVEFHNLLVCLIGAVFVSVLQDTAKSRGRGQCRSLPMTRGR